MHESGCGTHERDSFLYCRWSYPDPDDTYDVIRDHLAFHAGQMDACYLGNERVTPQPGEYYGGWITSNVVAPFKGEPGAEDW